MSKFNFREAYERMDAIKARYNEIATALENDKEREAYTDAEQAEMKQLDREMSILDAKVKANTQTINIERESNLAEANKQMREAIKNGQRFEVKVSRDVVNHSTYAAGLAGTNPFNLTTEDIVKPLYPKTILSAVGAPLYTGLTGNHQWPIVEAFEATIGDEGVELGDTKIPVDKKIAHPERIGVVIPITREALNETDNLLLTIAKESAPLAVAKMMNRIMFASKKVAGASRLAGPFVTEVDSEEDNNLKMKAANIIEYSGAVPTFPEVIRLKSRVLGSDIEAEQLCYVMNEATKGDLEATTRGKGDRMIVEEDKINGLPVFTSSLVADGDVLFGAFKYAPQGLFGDMSFIIDPYTRAGSNAIRVVLNVNYAITVLRKEAFAKLTKKSV